MEAIVNPSATGGAGQDFEFKVGAAALTLLLTGGAPFFLETGAIKSVHFQTRHLGWKTDDLLLDAADGRGLNRKAAVQVKRAFVLSEKDVESVETLRRAFTDFNNPALFNQKSDAVGLITSSLSANLVRGLRTLLDCARASTNAPDMARRLQIPGYLGKLPRDYYQKIVLILRPANGESPDDDEIWRFLRCFNVVQCDFDLERGFSETMMRSLLAVTTPDNNPTDADATWNALHALAAARTGTAASFTRENLPATLLQRHIRPSGYPAAIARLLEDTRVVLDGIRTTIGGKIQISRREIFGQLCQLLEENPLVFVTGQAGSGKSVLAKMGFTVASAGTLGIASRAESLAGTHINEVLARFGLTLDGLRAQTASHGRKILWIESAERLMEKPAEERAAFLDLLRALKEDSTWKLLITCRDYSAETVRTAFFGEAGIPCVEIFVPELSDDELNEVTADFPVLKRPMSSGALRRLLRKPFLLDKAVQMQWPESEPLPSHERTFREKVWREVVRRPDEGQPLGLPRLRSEVLVEVALRRAKAMKPFVPAAGLDARALHGLVRDSLLATPANIDDHYAPAHDVFEDWALANWLDAEFELAERRLTVLFDRIGTFPAVRRAYRKWLTELLDISPETTDALLLDVIRNHDITAHWQDDTLVGVLQSRDANGFLHRNAALLKDDGAKLLRQVIHILRVACRAAIPRRLFGVDSPGDFFLPSGNGWSGAAELMAEAKQEFEEADLLFVLGFMEDWVQLTRWGIHYPGGARAVAKLAMHWLPIVKPWRGPTRDSRERLCKILLAIPLAAKEELAQMTTTAMADAECRHDYRELLELMFSHFYAAAFHRDMPELAIKVVENTLGFHLPLERVLQVSSGSDMNQIKSAFGLGFRSQMDDYPASAYHGPFFNILSHHPQQGIELILKFANRACEAYAHPSNRHRGLSGPTRISIVLPDGKAHKQIADGRLWILYRDLTPGPDSLKSALMALERWLLDKAARGDEDLAGLLNRLLYDSNNIAVTAVVASVATAYPIQAGTAGLSVLTCKRLFSADLDRTVSETMNARTVGTGYWLGIEKQKYDEERAESARLPHRQRHLEYLAVMLQTSDFREQVLTLLDGYKAALPPENEQNESDKVWRFRLHQMDTRNFVKVGETEDGRVMIQAGRPPPDLQKMLDEKQPGSQAWEAATSLFVWGRSVLQGPPATGMDPEQWKLRLAAAQTQLSSIQDQADEIQASMTSAGPTYVAAVCIRDHWPDLTGAEQDWCANLVCNSIDRDADTTEFATIAALNPMEASRPAAFILPALFEKQTSAAVQARLLPTLAKALTHSVEEVVGSVVQGIGRYLWSSDRLLALTCVHALILKATEEHRYRTERRRKPGPGLTEDQFRTNLLARVRGSVEARDPGDDSLILQLDWTRWPGRQVAPHLFTILGRQFNDPIARQFFQAGAAALVLRWQSDHQRRRSRDDNPGDEQELDVQAEHQFLEALLQFTLNLPEQEAGKIFDPICNVSSSLPEKAASAVKRLVIYQPESAPAVTFWTLWQRFAEDYVAGPLSASADKEYSDSAKLLRELFLGVDWGEAREWKPLHGEEHRIGKLFERLPASRNGFEAYSTFLEKVGSPTLPGSIIGLAAKIPQTGGASLFSESTIFYLENILTRLIYGGNRRIRMEAELRLATMKVLDVLVAAGSSPAYKLRDDFLTPA